MPDNPADQQPDPTAEHAPPPAATDPTRPPGTDPDAAASADPSEPSFESRYPLRPVDWDGNFSRTWREREGNELTRRLAAEHERKWEENAARQSLRATLARLDAEAARAEKQRHEEGEKPAVRIRNAELERKLDKLDRLSPDDGEESPESDGSAGPG
ncbi:hypothetical protein [Frankia sp. QA3]|uniref:hypothetical protein n=1 Tax=Frankia sp. QA3 TaxID=710111 RepID=UPI000269C713|nr:hypothetical protein [Frankia sp. QA3]EIV94489.1 hypothetical protein FraQA3DRAFT_4244 [Frankia sp. QA3]